MTETVPVGLSILSEEPSAAPPPSRGSVLSWYNLGYLSDLLYLVVVIAVAVWIDTLEPFKRPIDSLVLNDTDLKHPHLENIVSNVMLWIYALVVPACVGLLFFAVSWILGRLNSYDTSFSLHLYMISLLFALAITGLVTNIFKIWGGRFRPDFLDRCKYDELVKDCTGDKKLGWF
jgi:diacylglycerol diphosphate phosphatase/phosphatidate phosphatase